MPVRWRPGCAGIDEPHAESNFARMPSSRISWKPGSLFGIAPMSPPPCTLFWPRSGCRPEPHLPTLPVSSARLISAKTLSTALWCSVMPSVQQSCAFCALPYAWASSRIASAGTPVTRSASSSVHGSTEAR